MRERMVIVGGGAAGVFAAVAAAQANPTARVQLVEKGAVLLSKVKISGGGRCNVTHACFDPRQLSQSYPRGAKALMGAFHRFQAQDTVEWFEARGVELKTEPDGRMFPTTDSSQTVIDCLLGACRQAGVLLSTNSEIAEIRKCSDGRFQLTPTRGQKDVCDRLLLAPGGIRSRSLQALCSRLGHTVEPPVASLFTFHVKTPWLRELAGISLPAASVSVEGTRLKARGPILVTHWGLSGPAILSLSAWGARELHRCGYRFRLLIDWLPDVSQAELARTLESLREDQPGKPIAKHSWRPIPQRLWGSIVAEAGVQPKTRWSELSGARQHALIQQLKQMRLPVTGKSLNKDEFVTCGGVRLGEVDFKTMESRLVPGLFFAGEVLDVDGVTGGFNFQAAWTTGWIAGNNLALIPHHVSPP